MNRQSPATGRGEPERHHVSDLNTYHRNPRTGDVEAIMASMKANGVYKPIVVNRGTHTGRPMEVLAGNHSLKALRNLAEQHPDQEQWQKVDTWVVDVDEDRAARIVLADNRTSDLASYDDEELASLLGTLDGDLEGTGFDPDDLADLSDILATDQEELAGLGEGRYTDEVKVPHYEPTGVEPELAALYDDTKTQELLGQIEQADLPPDVRAFLELSAHRHTVIDFHQVANYYAHQPPEVQELMEAQALVIIDPEDAIAHGFTTLQAELMLQRGKDRGDQDDA